MAIDQDISNLPTPPSRNDSPSDFSDKADSFLGALPQLQTELNTYADEANAIAAQVNEQFELAAAGAAIVDASAWESATTYGKFDAAIDINISVEAGETAKVGQIVFGNQSILGITTYGTSVSIQDYSPKDTDDFGNVTLTKRRSAQLVDYDVKVQTSAVRNSLFWDRRWNLWGLGVWVLP
jgi:hypothetical protein